jgi:hypothetical protein
MQIITTLETKTYRSEVNESIVINYTVENRDSKPVDSINGCIVKNNNSAGFFNANRSGESSLMFISGHPLTASEKQAVSAQIYEDEPNLFNQVNE